MAFNIADTLRVILSHIAASGHVSSSSLGEPVGPPGGDKLHGAVYMRSTGVSSLYVDGGTRENHVAVMRLYRPVLRQPQAESELELALAASELLEDLVEDYTLGSNIREIDIAGGQGGGSLTTDWGHVEIGGVMYRVVDITVPIVVDDSATAAA